MLQSCLITATLVQSPKTLFVAGFLLMILFFWYFATDLERQKRNIGTLLIVGMCVLCGFAVYPPDKALKGGIDLVGGSSFTLVVDPKKDDAGNPQPLTKEQIGQAIKTIEKRVNAHGNVDMTIAQRGTNQILLQMPGMSPEDSAKTKATLSQVAKLELKEVYSGPETPSTDGRTLAKRVFDGDEAMPGYTAYKESHKREGQEFTDYILLSNRVALTGKDVLSARPEQQGSENLVSITLNSIGGEKMTNLTKNKIPRRDRIAVLLDNEILTAPVLNTVPLGNQFQITGQESLQEARDLSDAMMNPLENPLRFNSSNTITPTLGTAVVKQGVWAGIIGLTITSLFVLIYYRAAGLVALVGLAVNGLMIFGAMALFGFTFTLSGIAGIILSIGMAVDANVLIYERLREEMAAGKTLKNAISIAYDKAFSAILDSNMTSLITAVILLWKGTGTVQGFAITLVIGIVGSMFSAVLVTRVLFRWVIDLNILKKLSFLNLIKATNIDFIGKRKTAAIISLIMFAAAGAGMFIRKDKALGVDFTGGSIITLQLGDQKLEPADIENALKAIHTEKIPSIQEEKSAAAGNSISIRCANADVEQIKEQLKKSFELLRQTKPSLDKDGKENGTAFVYPLSESSVSATMGTEYLLDSCVALVLGLAGIIAYVAFRFEFSFSLGALVALAHDVILSIGVVVLLGKELSTIHVGAILTVAGFSVNDTIVIFDRIRESLRNGAGGNTKDLMNEAVNATLSRTILTAASTVVTVTILSIYGGPALEDFSLMILAGLLIGTYSSVFVATPVVLWWSNRKGGLENEVRKPVEVEVIHPAKG
ncbi:MAG: protein-export rane protein SecD [Akkermansiaceae bacterium]|nr:protein-export rane protein SecD [Akkermansiaceae bacterium]